MQFHLGDILSITTGRLVSPRHMDGVYAILNYMTGESLFTHQLIRAAESCKPALLAQHPQLANVEEDFASDNWQSWLGIQVMIYGEQLEVKPLSQGDKGSSWVHKDPIAEAVEMFGPDRVIVVKQGEEA